MFGIPGFRARRRDPVVADDVVVEAGPHGPGEAQPVDLDRGRASREDAQTGIAGVAVDVDQDVDAIGGDHGGGLVVGQVADGLPVFDGGGGALMDAALGLDAAIVGEDLDLRAVMQLEQLSHQIADGVVAQVGRHIADPQAAVG